MDERLSLEREPKGTEKARLLITVVFGAVGLFVSILHAKPERWAILSGLNDFPQLYFGPKLLASHELYRFSSMHALQLKTLGYANDHIQYVRLPYYAVLLWPLSLLPFKVAYAVWQVCSLGALIGFVRLWSANRALAFGICCWFPPVLVNFGSGQDVTFLLLWAALSTVLFQRGSPFWAGVVLALCAAKFHLLLFLPVMIVARRLWKVGAGLAAGSAVLLAISFISCGWDWPILWYRTISDPIISPVMHFSPLGLLSKSLGHSSFVVAGACLIIGIASVVWFCTRNSDFRLALSVALAVGPICAYHNYTQDYLLVLPLLLIGIDKLVEPNRIRNPKAANVPV